MAKSQSILRIDGLFAIEIKETAFEIAVIAPPLLVSFASIDDYIEALSPDLKAEFEDEIRSLHARGLPPVVSSRCLAVLIGFSTKFVNAMVQGNKKYYREFSIPKGRKKRKIQAPRVALKVIQKWFGHHLCNALEFDEHLYGFIPGRSAVGAASQHCGARWVYSIDIEDFFPTTTAPVVAEALARLGYSQKALELIVPLCCYGEVLAQGAPSSPVLANLSMTEPDSRLVALANQHGLTYTRYADDMVFSGGEDVPENLVAQVADTFEGSCWSISEQKSHLADSQHGQRLKVHGLLVDGDRPRLTRGYRNRIRAYRHLLATERVREEDKKRLEGHVKYAESVENFEP